MVVRSAEVGLSFPHKAVEMLFPHMASWELPPYFASIPIQSVQLCDSNFSLQTGKGETGKQMYIQNAFAEWYFSMYIRSCNFIFAVHKCEKNNISIITDAYRVVNLPYGS